MYYIYLDEEKNKAYYIQSMFKDTNKKFLDVVFSEHEAELYCNRYNNRIRKEKEQ